MKLVKVDAHMWQYGDYYILKEVNSKNYKGVISTRHIIYNKEKKLTTRDGLKKAIKYIDEL
jgi:hypothetical protein